MPARSRPLSLTSHRCMAAAALLACQTAAGGAHAQGAEPWPAAIHAEYRLKYNGIEVGSLIVNSARAGNTYTLSGHGKVSVLFGAVTWTGNSNVSGMISGGAPQPVKYAFEWKNNRKHGTIRMGFKDRVATEVAIEPPHKANHDDVPLKPPHKAGAFDPVSALLMLTKADDRPPCDRRVEIFDGKQRYDIALSFKRNTTLPEGAGAKGELAYVCRAMYVPVAGHRDNEATKTYAANKDVEVVMRRVPGSPLLIPYSVHIPTAWGSGTMVTDRIEVTMPGGTKVALGK